MSGFEEEVHTLSKFRHPNLVTLLGWGKHAQIRYLVYELMVGGDIFDRLTKSRHPQQSKPFHWYERISAALDAATGLSHMHNSKPKAFHRDIKAANILLDRHGTAKMADFGLSCTSTVGTTDVQVKTISGTPGYACPIYSRTGRVTEASEVYSFGMVLLETLTGLAPAAVDPRKPGGLIYPIADAITPGAPGALERCVKHQDATASWPPALVEDLATLALRSVNATDESKRPRFVEVVRGLRGLTEKYPRPEVGAASPLPASASFPSSVGADKSSAGGVSSPGAPPAFMLELVAAEDVEVSSLPPERRRLLLVPAGEVDGHLVAPVGRQHHQELFEVWLPDQELRSCISRTAFEIRWLPGTTKGCKVVARGNNPVTLNGKLLTRGETLPLESGSELGFPYSQSGELALFLRLRFAPVSLPPAAAAAEASAQTAALDFGVQDARSVGTSWLLVISEVEGLSAQQLSSFPESVRTLQIGANSTLTVGRQHQPQTFEALLSQDPTFLSYISRSHVELQAKDDMLVATNVSSNPFYIDGEALSKSESVQLVAGQEISFARLDGSSHALFFRIKVFALQS
eukprot:TRINITY_DN7694_c0_g1_i1.p1 TRINITY_DN7694_c0_g1~~TRINITY_DN7694_c0_g1_i1.p1  ORF type:complete len:599 (-),score=117.75 TRINITY_DN7694_c0_g1_i1:164-1888(-)